MKPILVSSKSILLEKDKIIITLLQLPEEIPFDKDGNVRGEEFIILLRHLIEKYVKSFFDSVMTKELKKLYRINPPKEIHVIISPLDIKMVMVNMLYQENEEILIQITHNDSYHREPVKFSSRVLTFIDRDKSVSSIFNDAETIDVRGDGNWTVTAESENR